MSSFNSKEYSWANVHVAIGGNPVVGIKSVSYRVVQDKNFLRGAGNKALAIQSGNITISGSITLFQSELEALISASKAAGFSKLTQVSWDIPIAYAPRNGEIGTPLAKTIIGAEFDGYEEAMSQGSLNMEITLKFKALDIKQV